MKSICVKLKIYVCKYVSSDERYKTIVILLFPNYSHVPFHTDIGIHLNFFCVFCLKVYIHISWNVVFAFKFDLWILCKGIYSYFTECSILFYFAQIKSFLSQAYYYFCCGILVLSPPYCDTEPYHIMAKGTTNTKVISFSL